MSLFSPTPLLHNTENSQEPKPPVRLSWRDHLRSACRGIKLGIRSRSSFFVLFFFAALAILAGGILRCSAVQWCMLILGIGLVLIAELFHSAFIVLVGALERDHQHDFRHSRLITAGAVLLAYGVALLIGVIVLASQLWQVVMWAG